MFKLKKKKVFMIFPLKGKNKKKAALCILLSLRITKNQQLFTTKIGVKINDFTLLSPEKNVADFRGFNSTIPLSF